MKYGSPLHYAARGKSPFVFKGPDTLDVSEQISPAFSLYENIIRRLLLSTMFPRVPHMEKDASAVFPRVMFFLVRLQFAY